MKKLTISLLLALAVTGCASTKMADPAADAKAKQFIAKADKATVYVYRNESMGAGVKMDVKLDNKVWGETVAKSYLVTDVDPGKHTIVSSAENDSSLSLDTVAGKIYYVWQEVKMGVMYARNKLQPVDEKTGQAGVNESKLVAGQL